MNKIKKFWVGLFALLPFAAGAASPIILGGLAGLGVIAGFSIYRTAAPVDMSGAYSFFSSCWSCQMFSDVVFTISNILSPVYSAIGTVIIPLIISLTAIWFVWRLLAGYIGMGKVENAWSMAGGLSIHILKLSFVIILLLAPLPRMISSIAIEPIFNTGFYVNRMTSLDNSLSACVVATAVADPTSVSKQAANSGIFSPKMRHNLTCEIAQVHKLTGLGMATGWTMLNMAFDAEYMHKFLWDIPFFPNIMIFFSGLLIMVLFFLALVPVPMYFLQVVIKLGMDLVMLPIMLMSWVFKDWKIFPQGGKSLRAIIDDVIQGTIGIAMIGVFLSFGIFFLNGVAGSWNGKSALEQAFFNNDPDILMQGLTMNNDSLVVVILLGLFFAMFMGMIPSIIKKLFSNVKIPDEFYNNAKKNIETIRNRVVKIYESYKKE